MAVSPVASCGAACRDLPTNATGVMFSPRLRLAALAAGSCTQPDFTNG